MLSHELKALVLFIFEEISKFTKKSDEMIKQKNNRNACYNVLFLCYNKTLALLLAKQELFFLNQLTLPVAWK